ncbi:phasin family protein [Tahibacter amnicola]|uniref:Phasin family protein n=1 Tax=Tahibacter amnicola TaxID=2976241 RepID=A0ABY6BFY5_9GAMM|nr:phasin family protein [Tahibacter amnicola]UXI68745.1 phasin family protein [Tahibacter amnicola]
MIEQYNNQVLAFSKSFADAAFKVQGLALQNFEKIADLQLKTFENRANATAAFVSEALEVRDFDGLKAIWPKSVSLAKESAEKVYSTSQEVFGLGIKTSEALGELAKTTFAATNETLQNQANAFKKAAPAAPAK